MRNPEDYKVRLSPKNSFVVQKGNHLKITQHAVDTGSELVNSIVNQPPSETDPQGSYTGVPLDEYETPVQDADDL